MYPRGIMIIMIAIITIINVNEKMRKCGRTSYNDSDYAGKFLSILSKWSVRFSNFNTNMRNVSKYPARPVCECFIIVGRGCWSHARNLCWQFFSTKRANLVGSSTGCYDSMIKKTCTATWSKPSGAPLSGATS